ncbi:hypothetical protein MPSEU_001010500 [Mayamaea pseudoterrestris]|nr:hypothetical protein MPSEU_001010500 [Mayamaea pseudoterrestris]
MAMRPLLFRSMSRPRKTRSDASTSNLLSVEQETTEFKYKRRRRNFRWTVALLLVIATLLGIAVSKKELRIGTFLTNFLFRIDRGLTVADVLAARTVVIAETFRGHVHVVTPIAAKQIENYKQGTGLIVNVHFTHHGGTYACHALGMAAGQRGSPSFACMGLTATDNVTAIEHYPAPERVPWSREETSRNIATVRKHFHFLNWEFGSPELAHLKGPLSEADWENPNLVSVLVVREPLSRLLAIDGWVRRRHPTVSANTASRKEWMDYAMTPHNNTNNFALAILAGNGCCQGKDTKVEHLAAAKEILSRMTFVIDIACLRDGLEEVAHILGFQARNVERRRLQSIDDTATPAAASRRDLKLHRTWPSPKQRLPPKIYDVLVERNRLDIELYEWAKEISVVRCPPSRE